MVLKVHEVICHVSTSTFFCTAGRNAVLQGGLLGIYLEEVIRRVMHQHDEGSSTDVVHTPREADEEDGCYMVDYLLLEVLKTMKCMGGRRNILITL